MAAGCKKCDPHDLCEECPEWIFTLADLIMCMMGLFVILWVLKPSPKETIPAVDSEQTRVLAAIREAFDYVPDPTSDDPIDIYLLLKKLEKLKMPKGPGDGGKTELERRGAVGTDPEVTTIRLGKQASTGGRMAFDIGSDKVTPQTAATVVQIAAIIRGHRNVVVIKGHTSLDDLPDGASPQEKMDLAVRRAQAVAELLIAQGVNADILRVQGCSTFEPVVQRDYEPDGQVLNRRVEVEATSTLVEELMDRREENPATGPVGTTTPVSAPPAEH
jgi:chemotaxis protein MotB